MIDELKIENVQQIIADVWSKMSVPKKNKNILSMWYEHLILIDVRVFSYFFHLPLIIPAVFWLLLLLPFEFERIKAEKRNKDKEDDQRKSILNFFFPRPESDDQGKKSIHFHGIVHNSQVVSLLTETETENIFFFLLQTRIVWWNKQTNCALWYAPWSIIYHHRY